MTGPRTRLLAAAATAAGLIAGGFDAHLAPQGDGFWHGLTGGPSWTRIASALIAASLVGFSGARVNVRPFLWMSLGLLPLLPASTGFGAPALFFSSSTMILIFSILACFALRDLLLKVAAPHPGVVVLIAFLVFVFVGRFLPGPAGPQGDEPHYLLIAESLLKDGDVDLKNQFDERAFSKFTGGNLEPHTAPRSPKDKLYAIHTPGLSAVVAPGYALGGFSGARAVTSALMALSVGLLYITSQSLFGPAAATFVFLAATFASPLPIYANSLYPDSVATLPVAATLACLASTRLPLLAFASAAIAVLPWLHPRFLPLALLLALALAAKGRLAPLRSAMAFVPLAISFTFLLLHFHELFGRASLSAAYGPGFSSDVSLTRLPWGASALILDRQFGLLLFSPLLLLSMLGARRMWRTDRFAAATLLGIAAVFLGVGGSFSMWWGGASPPARFLIGATPALLMLGGALWKMGETRPELRALLGTASGYGLGLLVLACLAPRALHNRGDGESGLLRLLSPMLDTDRFFPGFVTDAVNPWIAMAWVVALVAMAAKPRLAVATLSLALVAGAGSLTASTPLLKPFASSLRALEAWSEKRRTFGGSDLRLAFELEVPLGPSPWELGPGTVLHSPRFSLPQGPWTIRVSSRTVPDPGALNVARISLVGDHGDPIPETSVAILVGEDVTESVFVLDRDHRRVRMRGEGLQSSVRILAVWLTPGPAGATP